MFLASGSVKNRNMLAFAAGLAAFLILPTAHAQIVFEASWTPPNYQAVRQQMLQWLDESDLEPDAGARVR